MLPVAAAAVRGATARGMGAARGRFLPQQPSQLRWQQPSLQPLRCFAGQGEVELPPASNTGVSPGASPELRGRGPAPEQQKVPLFRPPGPKVRAFFFWTCIGMATGYWLHGA
uniref:Uncharacterized protein n=1 Tax=Alexandrium catenella TaxID=2925 RepID=A0A7S1SFP8_ALECA|mmetsp:Transcript_9881/g.26848  ORF Transcript_9881/g.26848 Transcript_9881/m.26848 type:complete len:112 (+) Transcript_9881:117-452(+)